MASLVGWKATMLATLPKSSPLNLADMASFPPSEDHSSICLGLSIDPVANMFSLSGCQLARNGVSQRPVWLLCLTWAHGMREVPGASVL